MHLNLRKSAKAITKYLTQRIKDYPKYVNEGPGNDDDPITLITAGYQFDQAGWLAIVLDTRPGASPDGTWNSYIELNELEFPDWSAAFETIVEDGKSIQVTLPDGTKKTLSPDIDEEEFAAMVGDMIRDVFIEAQEKGKLKKLPLAESCVLCVEEHGGYYGWNDQQTGNLDDDSCEAYIKRLDRELGKRSQDEKIAYLIDELDQYAQGKGSASTWAFLFPDELFKRLKLIGDEAIVPVLKFIRRWAGKPEWDADRPKRNINDYPFQTIVFDALLLIQKHDLANAEVKRLLIQILRKSIKVNQQRRLWGIIPFWTASCLHILFDNYPEPKQDATTNALRNADQYVTLKPKR